MEQDSFSDLVGNRLASISARTGLEESRKIAEGILADCKDVKLCEVLQEEFTEIETSLRTLSTYLAANGRKTPNHFARGVTLSTKAQKLLKPSYILFCDLIYPKIISENSNTDKPEILRLISVEWKKFTPSQKDIFVKKAKANRVYFNDLLREYREFCQGVGK